MRPFAVRRSHGVLAVIPAVALAVLVACDLPSSPPALYYPVQLATYQAHRSTDSLHVQVLFATRACANGFIGEFAQLDSATLSFRVHVASMTACPDTAQSLFQKLWVVRLARAGTVRLVVDTTGGSTQVDVPGDGSLVTRPRSTDPCPGPRVYIAGIPLGALAYRDSVWLTARAVTCAGMQPIGRVAWSVRDSAIGSVHPVTDSQAVFRGATPGQTFIRAAGLDYAWRVQQFVGHSATLASP